MRTTPSDQSTRRQFLEETLILAATAATGQARASWGAEPPSATPPTALTSANDKLGVAVVGARVRGGVHLEAFVSRPDTEVRYVVDVDETVGNQRADEVGSKQGRKPKFVRDMRAAFDDPAVDIVSIATPNHWHALAAFWAMRAGKDVYVEKPVSHNVAEGRLLVEAARKYGRICQTGTQCRSMAGTIAAIKHVRSGAIGTVKLARGLCYNPRPSIGAKSDFKPPSEVDYPLWSGPAPLLPITRPQFHYDWHWQWPYGNGDLGNQGVHQMDLCRWGLGLNELSKRVVSYGGRLGPEDAGETPNTQVVMHEFDDATIVFEVRGLKTSPLRGASVGVIFYGSDGYVVLTSYTDGAAFDKQGTLLRTFSGDGDHFANFLSAVRSRKQEDLAADIREGHLSSALCHTGNISWRLGSAMPLGDARKRLALWTSQDDALNTFDQFSTHLNENATMTGPEEPATGLVSMGRGYIRS